MSLGLSCGPSSSCLYPMRMISRFTFEHLRWCLLALPARGSGVPCRYVQQQQYMGRCDSTDQTSSWAWAYPVLTTLHTTWYRAAL